MTARTDHERAEFEKWLGIKPCGAAHDFGWEAWKARAALAATPQNHIADAGQMVENVREGAPYENPAFEKLARELGVWGTAQSAVCAQFWLAATPAADAQKAMPWLQVVDEEMVLAHIGVAEASDDYATAKDKINRLICWHIDVAKYNERAAAAPVVLPEPFLYSFEEQVAPIVGSEQKIARTTYTKFKPSIEHTAYYTEQQVRALLATGGQAKAVLTGELIEAVDAWFARNTGLGGCSDKDVAELAAIFAAPQAQADARDAWPSIESAPKDGTWIQLWRTPEPEESPVNSTPLVIGRWSDEEESFVWPDDQFYDPFTEHGKAKADQMVEAMQTYASNEFTHWAPLSMPSVHRAAIAAAKGE